MRDMWIALNKLGNDDMILSLLMTKLYTYVQSLCFIFFLLLYYCIRISSHPLLPHLLLRLLFLFLESLMPGRIAVLEAFIDLAQTIQDLLVVPLMGFVGLLIHYLQALQQTQL